MEFGLLLLAQAMLELAIADVRAGVGRPEWTPRGKRAAEARDWLFNPERRALIKFEDCAAMFDLDADWLRKEIRAEYTDGGVSDE
jgi:hypothetical protein